MVGPTSSSSSSSSSSHSSSHRTRPRQEVQQLTTSMARTAALVLLLGAASVVNGAAHSCAASSSPVLGFVLPSSQLRRPRAATAAVGQRVSSVAAATGSTTRLYMAGGEGSGGANSNENNKPEELYYQRFLGMNEGEPTDEVRLAAEIADMDPSTIDSLRRGSPSTPAKVNQEPPRPPANPFYGTAGSPPPQQVPQAQQSQQQTPQPFGTASIGGAAGGFMGSVKAAATKATSNSGGNSNSANSNSVSRGNGGGSSSSFVPLMKGGGAATEADSMMSGPRAYVIPQDGRESPLEIRSVPAPRRSQKGVIAEVPGRRLPKRPGRVDLGEKMAEVKRSLKEAPTRLTEMQMQNLRNNMNNPTNGGSSTTPTPAANPGGGKADNAPSFTFPSFPVQLPTQQQQQQQQKRGGAGVGNKAPFAGMNAGSGRQRGGLKRRGQWGGGVTGRPASGQKTSLPPWSRDWRVLIGAIAAVSFFTALINAFGARSELIVQMDSAGQVGGAADLLLQNAADLGVDRYFV